MNFEPAPSRGGWVGLGLLAGLLGLQLALVAVALGLGLGPLAALLLVGAALLLPLAARLALWLWGYATLSYSLSREGLVIRWGASRQMVPMEDITHVLNGRPYARALSGLRWPGHEVGRTALELDDETTHEALVFATRPPAEQLVIVTPDLAYAISPADRALFVEEFRVRSHLGPVQRLGQAADRPAWARLPIWSDSLALRLAWLGLGLNLFAFAWLVWHYPSLPGELPLQWVYDPAAGAAAAGPARPRAGVWLLPLIGLAGTLLNGALATVVHQRDRMAALLLLVGAVLLQLALGVVLGLIT